MPIFLLVALLAMPELSQSPGAPRAIAGSVSGGGSLGAYEAGYLYYATANAQAANVTLPLRLMTGASAGSINTFLSLLSVCGDPTSHMPADSVFWRVWSDLSVASLFSPPDVTAVSMVSRKPLENIADMLEPLWRHGLREGCDVVWGVPTTRLQPRSITLARGGLELPRTEEKFLVRIRGRGFGKPPSARNYVDRRSGFEQATLVTDAEGEVPYDALKDLIFASSAFPAAFSPQKMRYCLGVNGSDTCEASEALEAMFIDGGVLDNAPLRLTVRTLGAGLRTDKAGNFYWLDAPRLDEMEVADDVRIGFISPDAADYPSFRTEANQGMPKSMLRLGVDLAAGFVAVARSKELYTIIEERPDMAKRIFIPRRSLPSYSAPLQGFLGFFERDFRVFDFALGMLAAERGYRERAAQVHTTWQPALRPGDDAGNEPWPTFECLQRMLDAPPEAPWDVTSCARASSNQKALAQVALVRLYDHCARLPLADLSETQNAHCIAAARQAPPPTDMPEALRRTWRRSEAESDLLYIVRLLSAYRFAFVDMGLSADDAPNAAEVLRTQLDRMAAAVTAHQPWGSGRGVGLVARVAIDAMTRQAEEWEGFITLADMIEGGVTWLLPVKTNQSWRLNGAILLDGWSRLLTSDSGNIGLGAAAGLEWDPAKLRSAFFESRIIARVGYMFGQGDGFDSRPCANRGTEKLGACSRMLVQGGLGFTVLDDVRLQLLGSWYPPLRRGEKLLWSVSPGVGVQF